MFFFLYSETQFNGSMILALCHSVHLLVVRKMFPSSPHQEKSKYEKVKSKFFSPHSGNFIISEEEAGFLHPFPMKIYLTSLHSIVNLRKNVERFQTSLVLFFHFILLRIAEGCYNKAKGHSVTVSTVCPQGTRQLCAPLPGSIGPNMADQTSTHDYEQRHAVSVLPVRAFRLPSSVPSLSTDAGPSAVVCWQTYLGDPVIVAWLVGHLTTLYQ